MLEDPCMKSVDLARDFLAILIETVVTNPAVTLHEPAHIRHAQASFPVASHLCIEDIKVRVHQHRERNGPGVRIARIRVMTLLGTPI